MAGSERTQYNLHQLVTVQYLTMVKPICLSAFDVVSINGLYLQATVHDSFAKLVENIAAASGGWYICQRITQSQIFPLLWLYFSLARREEKTNPIGLENMPSAFVP